MTTPRKGAPTARLDDRRVAPRAATSIAATVIAGRRTIELTVEDLSVTGARLVGPMPMTVGQRIRVAFVLDGVSVDVLADVVRVQSPNLLTDRTAVQFVDMCVHARAAVAALVTRALRFGVEDQDLDEDITTTGRVPRSARDADLDAATVRFMRDSGSAHDDSELDVATVRYVKKKELA